MSHTAQVKRFLSDDSGSVAMEYGLLTGLVSMAAITGLEALGQQTTTLFYDLARTIDNVVAAVSRH